jgi:hypothetical protein
VAGVWSPVIPLLLATATDGFLMDRDASTHAAEGCLIRFLHQLATALQLYQAMFCSKISFLLYVLVSSGGLLVEALLCLLLGTLTLLCPIDRRLAWWTHRCRCWPNWVHRLDVRGFFVYADVSRLNKRYTLPLSLLLLLPIQS